MCLRKRADLTVSTVALFTHVTSILIHFCTSRIYNNTWRRPSFSNQTRPQTSRNPNNWRSLRADTNDITISTSPLCVPFIHQFSTQSKSTSWHTLFYKSINDQSNRTLPTSTPNIKYLASPFALCVPYRSGVTLSFPHTYSFHLDVLPLSSLQHFVWVFLSQWFFLSPWTLQYMCTRCKHEVLYVGYHTIHTHICNTHNNEICLFI